ncbi:MAG: hypothetical protein WBM96_09180 [Polyangiales bacterium]
MFIDFLRTTALAFVVMLVACSSADGGRNVTMTIETILWTASITAPPGECAVSYLLRDFEGEVIGSSAQQFGVPHRSHTS